MMTQTSLRQRASLLVALLTLSLSAHSARMRGDPASPAQSPSRFAAHSPGGTWIEELAWARSHAENGELTSFETAEILRRGGAPTLAVLGASDGSDDEDEVDVRGPILDALASDAWNRAEFVARHSTRPSNDDPRALAAWLIFQGESKAALDVIATLAPDDSTPEATLLRVWIGLRGDLSTEDPTPLIDELNAVRGKLRGDFVALEAECDTILRQDALGLRSAWRGETAEGPPDWTYAMYPPSDIVAGLTDRDRARCNELLAQIGALSADAPDRDAREAELLAQACAADTFAADPWFKKTVMHNRRGETVLALAAVDSGLRRDPGSAVGWAIRAATTELLGDVRATLLAAERALELDPANATVEQRYLACLVRLGCLDEAALAARDVVRSEPGNPWAAIAFALGTRETGRVFDDGQRRRVSEHLGHWDEAARLWAAATLAVLDEKLDGQAEMTLARLAGRLDADPVSVAARALIQNDASVPLWGGVAALMRRERARAAQLWARDAAGSGTAAIAARGFLAHYSGHVDWREAPPLPEYAPEPLVVLPDPSAVAVRIPGEAHDIQAALREFPEGARRIVLARGTYNAPETISAGIDLVGVGVDTVVTNAKREQGGIEIELSPDVCLRLAELRWDSWVQVHGGRVVARRVQSTAPWWFTAEDEAGTEAPSEFHDVTFSRECQLRGRAARVRFEDCVWDHPLISDRPLNVHSGRAELVRCILQQSVSYGAPIRVDSKEASVLAEDCRFLGNPPTNRSLRPVVEASDGARATLQRCRIVDLDPVASADVTAEACSFQRTVKHSADLPGWTAYGAARNAPQADLSELRVPGDFASLDQALAAAEPGRKILLGAGVHVISSEIVRDVNLEGAGMQQTVVHVAAGRDTLMIRGANVVINELMLVGAGVAIERQGERYDVPMLRNVVPGEVVPKLVTLRQGTLAFGTNVIARDPRGLRFDVGESCSVSGRLGIWMLNVVPTADLAGDAVMAAMLDLRLRLWLEKEFTWSAPRPEDPGFDGHRPIAIALSADPEEHERTMRIERLRLVDEWLAQGWPAGGGALLAQAAPRIWNLVPESERVDAVLSRIEPRLSALARTDPRKGVEELITLAMSDLGGGNDNMRIFAAFEPALRAFYQNTPATEQPYVKARMQGMDQAQADSKARLAMCLDARKQGRVEQCLALADGLDAVARAELLSKYQPSRLTADQIAHVLTSPNLSSELRKRLQLLQKGSQSSTYIEPAKPTWAGALYARMEAERTGIPNRYYGVRVVYNQYGDFLRNETIERSDNRPRAANTNPRPLAPQPGASDAEWDSYYAQLETWTP
ncbi:MAG: hypothetical protein JNL28_09585 [Planctomycetes bacterium]|nr:hypothetical protein [Planctomycetota bacterium]